MKSLLFLSVVLGFIVGGCASSAPVSDDALVASEISVVNGHNPVLFVARNPDDGQWILLTDERAPKELVVYALFQDLAARDTSLRQVRDLQVGWKATRPAKGAPWVRERFLSTRQMTAQDPKHGKAASSTEGSPRRRNSSASPHYLVTVVEENEESPKVRQINVEDRSLAVWLVEGTDNRTSTLLWRDTLTSAARRSVDSLVQLCGLDTLKEIYTNPLSPRGMKFSFSIWDVNAERSTWSQLRNCWVPPLYELCAHINTLLPKYYAMNLALSKE